jgi:hypothetical protein
MRSDCSTLSDPAHPKRIEIRGGFHVPEFEIFRNIGRLGQYVIHQSPSLEIPVRIVDHLFAQEISQQKTVGD